MPTGSLEYRTSFDVRANAEGQGFDGHASHFWSVDSYYTAVADGAFKKTIKERGEKILVAYNHNPERIIGRATDLKEDKTGLYFNARISDTTDGRDIMTMIRDEVPFGVSFSFKTVKSRPGTDDDPLTFTEYKGKPSDIEILTEMKLYELGPVPFPANELADIAAVRARAEIDYLTNILNAIRSGELSDELEAAARQIQDALSEQAGAGTPTPLEIEARRRKRNNDVRAALALARTNGLLGVQA